MERRGFRRLYSRLALTIKMDVSDQNIKENDKNEKPHSKQTALEVFTEAGFKMLMETIKKSNKLPMGKARDLYESYPCFHSLMKNQSNSVLSVITALIKHGKNKVNFQKMDDEDKFEVIVDANDSLLENVGISLDELSGIKKDSAFQLVEKPFCNFNGSWNRKIENGSKNIPQILNTVLSNTKYIQKPQLKFKDKVNNDANVLFEPKIKYKYNMLKPLSVLEEINDDGTCQFTHPYEFELMKFKPSKELLTPTILKQPKPLEDTPFHFISKPEEIDFMIKDLEKYKEISVDLEHHSYRSFQGFTCLMQISTRDSDYVIDTLSLRSELQILNKIFTDPSVVKVFHGAALDILWLQKDLGLYVVNMIDTHQAAKLLNFPKLSLAYLLALYCNVTAQKHFQLADWRIRPLPEELLTYAREDTHYLLFIYDNLRNALLEKAHGQTNLLEAVISESTALCLRRYNKPLFETDGYLDMYQRSKKLFDNRQKFALEQLFKWRDVTARELDESYLYVLPNHMMLNISEVLPREAQGILACCNPIPVPVKQNLLKLHQIILKARNQPLIKPVLEEQKLYRHTTSINSLDNPLQCPHDLNHEGEFRDDLPVLFLNNSERDSDSTDVLSTQQFITKPIVNVFDKPATLKKIIPEVAKEKLIHSSPYHRYKLAKKFLESTEAKKQNTNINLDKVKKEEKIDAPSNHSNEKLLDEESQKVLSTPPSNEETTKSRPLKKKKKRCRQNKVEENEESRAKKQKIEENEADSSKKVKIEENEVDSSEKQKIETAEASANLSIELQQNEDKPLNTKETTKRKDKRKKIKQNFKKKVVDEQFQPFDFKSVNFNNYCSEAASKTKKVEQMRTRRKKKAKKNFKISV